MQWSHVSELTTDAPVKVLLNGGETHQGRIAVTAEPAVADEGGRDRNVLLRTTADIEMINAEPAQIDKGWEFTGRVNAGLRFERGNSDENEIDFDGSMTLRVLNQRIH